MTYRIQLHRNPHHGTYTWRIIDQHHNVEVTDHVPLGRPNRDDAVAAARRALADLLGDPQGEWFYLEDTP